jgi:hypothetical protein
MVAPGHWRTSAEAQADAGKGSRTKSYLTVQSEPWLT